MTESKLDKFERIVCNGACEHGYRRVSEGERGDKPRSVYFEDDEGIEYKVRLEIVEKQSEVSDELKGDCPEDCTKHISCKKNRQEEKSEASEEMPDTDIDGPENIHLNESYGD